MKRSWLGWSMCLLVFLWGTHLSMVGCVTPGPVSEESASESTSGTESSTEQVADGSAETIAEPVAETVTETVAEPAAEQTSDAGESIPEVVAEVTPETQIGPFDGTPIQAAEKTWTWVDFPDTKCGYGSPTGLGVNLVPGAKRLLIYMQGGGACWLESGIIGSCFQNSSASNLNGFSKTQFEGMSGTKTLFFDRNASTNVFADAHFVFIPYCTGDVYTGDKETKFPNGKTMHFHGHKNMLAYFKRLVPTFKDVEHVIISGSSAGGFGSSMNWWLAQHAFGDKIKVDLLNDSGPPMNPVPGRWEEWVKAWNMQLPPGCTDCTQGIDKILTFFEKNLLAKGRKMGFLGHDRDQVIRTFFGYLDGKGDAYKAEHDKLLTRLDALTNVAYFVLAGTTHTFFGDPASFTGTDGTVLPLWVERMVKADPAWKSTKP